LLYMNNTLSVGGVDEAGRGSIIGPLVVAGISFRKDSLCELRNIGVKDSKALTPQSRVNLYNKIKDLASSTCIYKMECSVIDRNVNRKRLNRLEARMMAHVINNLKADEVFVDSCDVNPERYKDFILSYMPKTNVQLHSMHHADRTVRTVAAASIVAKVTRDIEMEKIRKRHSDIGSGYPSDKKTMGFIRDWVSKYKCPPEFARKSWRPLKRMLIEIEQYEIDHF
jgi:ribonuclease HII